MSKPQRRKIGRKRRRKINSFAETAARNFRECMARRGRGHVNDWMRRRHDNDIGEDDATDKEHEI